MPAGQEVWPHFRGNWRGEARGSKKLKCAGFQKFNTTLAAGAWPLGSVLVHNKYFGIYQTIENSQIVTKEQYQEHIFCVYEANTSFIVKCLNAHTGDVVWTHIVDKTKFIMPDTDSNVLWPFSGFIADDNIYIPFGVLGKKTIGGMSVKYLGVGHYCLDTDGNYLSCKNATYDSGILFPTYYGPRWGFQCCQGLAEYNVNCGLSARGKENNIYFDFLMHFYSRIEKEVVHEGLNRYSLIYNISAGTVNKVADKTGTEMPSTYTHVGIASSQWLTGNLSNPVFRDFNNNVLATMLSENPYKMSMLSFEQNSKEYILSGFSKKTLETAFYHKFDTNRNQKWEKTAGNSMPACVYFFSSLLTGTVPVYIWASDTIVESWSDPCFPGLGAAQNWRQSNMKLVNYGNGQLPVTDGWGIYLLAENGIIGYSLDGSLLFEYTPGSGLAVAEPSLGTEYLYAYISGGGALQVHAVTSSYGLNSLDVTETDPGDTEIDVEPNTEIKITFTRQLDYTTITPSSVEVLNAAQEELPYTIKDTTDCKLIIVPDAWLPYAETIAVQLTTDIKSIQGYNLHDSHGFTFVTVSTENSVFSVVTFFPGNNAIDVPVETTLVVEFNYNIDISTVTQETCILRDYEDNILEYTKIASERTLTLSPVGGLRTGTLTLTTGLKNTTDKHLDHEYIFSYATELQEFGSSVGEAYIESPDDTLSEWTDILIVAPKITTESGVPQWREHFKIFSYREAGHTNLIDTKSTETNPELFQYTINNGITWRDFPPTGLSQKAYQNGAKIKVRIKTGRQATAYLVPYVGAEPA